MDLHSVEDISTVEPCSYLLDVGTEASTYKRLTGVLGEPLVHLLCADIRDTGASIL